MPGENFPLKKVNSWPMGQKDGDFFVLINPRANGNIFRVKKSHISLRCGFFQTLCIFSRYRFKSPTALTNYGIMEYKNISQNIKQEKWQKSFNAKRNSKYLTCFI